MDLIRNHQLHRETVIGLTLLTGRFVKVGMVVMAGAFVGILSPLALSPDQMWSHDRRRS